MIKAKKQMMETIWATRETMSTGLRLGSELPGGNQIRPNEVKWLQLHSYAFKVRLRVGVLQPSPSHEDVFVA
jgi:hypothetical protein